LVLRRYTPNDLALAKTGLTDRLSHRIEVVGIGSGIEASEEANHG
jgi:hypothetical protein